MKEDVYTLSSGDVVLQWPERISSEDSKDLNDWLDIMKRKIGRSVVSNDSDPGEREND